MTLRQLRTLGAWDLRQMATRLGVNKPNQSRADRIKAIWFKIKPPQPVSFKPVTSLPPIAGWSDFCKRMGCKDRD